MSYRRRFSGAYATEILFRGLYLTRIFHVVPIGVAAGPFALIVCLQPLLTRTLAGNLGLEVVTARQRFGVFLGFLGTIFIVDVNVGVFSHLMGLIEHL